MGRTFYLSRYLIIRFPWVYRVGRLLFRNFHNYITSATHAIQHRRPNHEPNNSATGLFSAEDLKGELIDWGISRGEILMVHSSMNDLRSYSGTVPEMIEMLLSLIGPEGTLCMPAFPRFMEKDKEGVPIFDICKTPSLTGLLPEIFRRRKGVLRSHQKRSVAALGPLAAAITGTHHLDPFPCGPCSPYVKFAEFRAKLLFLGVSPYGTNTMFHCGEDLLTEGLPFRPHDSRPRPLKIRDENGVLSTTTYYQLRPEITFLTSPELMIQYFTHDEVDYKQFRNTDLWLVDAERFLAKLLRLAQHGITYFGYRFPKPQILSIGDTSCIQK